MSGVNTQPNENTEMSKADTKKRESEEDSRQRTRAFDLIQIFPANHVQDDNREEERNTQDEQERDDCTEDERTARRGKTSSGWS